MSRNHAAFALEDVDDAQRGHPEFELKDYAAARKLRWYGSARPPGFSQVLPKFDDYVFNAMLIYSMGVSVDGFVADRDGAFEGIALDLIETRTFGSRVIFERYGRARDESR